MSGTMQNQMPLLAARAIDEDSSGTGSSEDENTGTSSESEQGSNAGSALEGLQELREPQRCFADESPVEVSMWSGALRHEKMVVNAQAQVWGRKRARMAKLADRRRESRELERERTPGGQSNMEPLGLAPEVL